MEGGWESHETGMRWEAYPKIFVAGEGRGILCDSGMRVGNRGLTLAMVGVLRKACELLVTSHFVL